MIEGFKGMRFLDMMREINFGEIIIVTWLRCNSVILLYDFLWFLEYFYRKCRVMVFNFDFIFGYFGLGYCCWGVILGIEGCSVVFLVFMY